MFTFTVCAIAGVTAGVVHLAGRWGQRPKDQCRSSVWEWLNGRERCHHSESN